MRPVNAKLAVLPALLALATTAQGLAPASAAAMDDAGTNSGSQCTLSTQGGVPVLLDANGNLCEVPGGMLSEVIHVESTAPKVVKTETRPPAERFPQSREGCPGFGCTKDKKNLDPDNLLGHPDDRKAKGEKAGKKKPVGSPPGEKPSPEECQKLGHDAMIGDERIRDAQKAELRKKINGLQFRRGQTGELADQETRPKLRRKLEEASRELGREIVKLQDEIRTIDGALANWEDGDCARTLRYGG